MRTRHSKIAFCGRFDLSATPWTKKLFHLATIHRKRTTAVTPLTAIPIFTSLARFSQQKRLASCREQIFHPWQVPFIIRLIPDRAGPARSEYRFPNHLMNARIALPGKCSFSPSRLATRVRTVIRESVEVSSARKSEKGYATFSIGNSRIVVRGSSKPVKWKDPEQVLADSDHWSPDRKSVLQHSANVGIGISGDDPPTTQARYLTAVVESALDQLPESLGVYWGAAAHFVPVTVFRELARDADRRSQLWVAVHTGNPGRRPGQRLDARDEFPGASRDRNRKRFGTRRPVKRSNAWIDRFPDRTRRCSEGWCEVW